MVERSNGKKIGMMMRFVTGMEVFFNEIAFVCVLKKIMNWIVMSSDVKRFAIWETFPSLPMIKIVKRKIPSLSSHWCAGQ